MRFVQVGRPNKDTVRYWPDRKCNRKAKHVFTLAGENADCVRAGIKMGWIVPEYTHIYSVDWDKRVAQKSFENISKLVGPKYTHIKNTKLHDWIPAKELPPGAYLDELFYDKCGALQFKDLFYLLNHFNFRNLLNPLAINSTATFTFCAPQRVGRHKSVIGARLDNYIEKEHKSKLALCKDSVVERYGVKQTSGIEKYAIYHAVCCLIGLTTYLTLPPRIVLYRDTRVNMMSFQFKILSPVDVDKYKGYELVAQLARLMNPLVV